MRWEDECVMGDRGDKAAFSRMTSPSTAVRPGSAVRSGTRSGGRRITPVVDGEKQAAPPRTGNSTAPVDSLGSIGSAGSLVGTSTTSHVLATHTGLGVEQPSVAQGSLAAATAKPVLGDIDVEMGVEPETLDHISARRARVLRRKRCRNLSVCLWLCGLSLVTAFLAFMHAVQITNPALARRIGDLEARLLGDYLIPHARRIQHLETDTADSVRALNVGANVLVARMGVVEQQVAMLTEILVTTSGGLNESIASSRTLRTTVDDLVNASALARSRLDTLNQSSTALLASGYQHTWNILARTGVLEGNVSVLAARAAWAQTNISNLWLDAAQQSANLAVLNTSAAPFVADPPFYNRTVTTLRDAVANLTATTLESKNTTARSINNTARLQAAELTLGQSVMGLRALRKALIPAASDGGTGNGTGHFQRLPGHTDFVNAVVALQSDSLFASASADISVRIWDGSKGTLVGTLQGSVGGQDHTARLLALAALPGGLLCSGGDDSKIIVWNTTAVPPVKLVQWTGHSGSVFALAAVGPGVQRVISGGQDNYVRLWDMQYPGVALAVLGNSAHNPAFGHTAPVIAVAALPNSAIASASRDNRVIIWVRASIGFQGETSANYTLGRILPPGDGDATCLTVLPGYQSALARTVLVVGYADNKVRLWEVATGALLDTWTVHTQPIYSLATMKDQTVAVGSADGRLSLWDPSATPPLISLLDYGDGYGSTLSALAVLPNGLLASASHDAHVAVWRNGYAPPSAL